MNRASAASVGAVLATGGPGSLHHPAGSNGRQVTAFITW